MVQYDKTQKITKQSNIRCTQISSTTSHQCKYCISANKHKHSHIC